jgi:hypothetical protein
MRPTTGHWNAGFNGDDDGRRVYMRAMALEIGWSAAGNRPTSCCRFSGQWSGISKFDVPLGLELGVESSNSTWHANLKPGEP